MRPLLPTSRRRKNPLVDEVHDYSPSELDRLFRISGSLLKSLASADFITATSEEGATSYSFQDLLILRTASALKAANIAEPKIIAALGNIRSALTPGSVLTTLALAAGKKAVKPHGLDRWNTKSAAADAEVNAVVPIRRLPAASAARGSASRETLIEAQAHYARGHQLEESDVTAARDAYLKALHAHSDHLEARINLGRLLHLNGELKEAEKVYRQAKTSSALLSFNLGILLEDLDRDDEAAVAYRDALAQDPSLHDAHYNLSRLHERAERPRDALRHLLAFRRHLLKYGDSSPT